MEDTGAWVSEYDENETFWLSQKAMGELFDCSTDNISLHIKNIYAEDELSEEATAEFFSAVQKEGHGISSMGGCAGVSTPVEMQGFSGKRA